MSKLKRSPRVGCLSPKQSWFPGVLCVSRWNFTIYHRIFHFSFPHPKDGDKVGLSTENMKSGLMYFGNRTAQTILQGYLLYLGVKPDRTGP
jgi:hypothetical protein